MKTDHFAYHLTKYFADYLPNQLAASKNTIHSYRDTFVQLFEFYKEKQHISPEKLNYACFTAPRIEEFLTWLEETRKISASTRNQRLGDRAEGQGAAPPPHKNGENGNVLRAGILRRLRCKAVPCRSITWIWKKPHCFFLFQIKAILHS